MANLKNQHECAVRKSPACSDGWPVSPPGLTSFLPDRVLTPVPTWVSPSMTQAAHPCLKRDGAGPAPMGHVRPLSPVPVRSGETARYGGGPGRSCLLEGGTPPGRDGGCSAPSPHTRPPHPFTSRRPSGGSPHLTPGPLGGRVPSPLHLTSGPLGGRDPSPLHLT